VISRVAELRPAQCHGLVYYSAFVPCDGRAGGRQPPPQFIEFLDRAAARSADRAITLSDGLLKDALANTADEQTLARIRALLVPEPHAPIFETLSLARFSSLEIPTAYIPAVRTGRCRPARFILANRVAWATPS
jgi:hypothetical protein